MNAGILAPGYAPPVMPRPLLGQPQPVPTPYGRSGDPYWDNVSLYLRMNGPHGSRTFTDLSKNRFTVTANGDAQISGQMSRFDSASGLFDGNGDFLTVLANAAFSFGTGDWTAECWFRINGNSALSNSNTRVAALMTTAVATPTAITTFGIFLEGSSATTGTGITYYQNTPSVVTITRTLTIRQEEWHHVAVTRNANSLRIFFNGVQQGAASSITVASGDSTRPLLIGRLGFSGFVYDLNGNIQDVRITRGVARYVSAFTPPTAPFPIGYQ